MSSSFYIDRFTPINEDETIIHKNWLTRGVLNIIDGKITIPCRFISIHKVPDYDVYICQNAKELYGVVNKQGNTIIPFEYNNIQVEIFGGNNLLLCKKDNIYKVYSNEGVILYEYAFDYVSNKEYNDKILVCFKTGGKFGLSDIEGNTILPAEYQAITFHDNLIILVKDNKKALIDPTKDINSTIWYNEIVYRPLSNTFIVSLNDKKSLLNSIGNTIIPFKYKTIEECWDGHYTVSKDNILYGVINQTQKTIIPFEYNSISIFFNSDRLRVSKYGQEGIIDTNGNVIIPTMYKRIIISEDGYIVNIDHKYGFVDNNNYIKIPCIYDDLNRMEGASYFKAKNNDKYGLIDINGNNILPFEYDNILDILNHQFRVEKNGKYGMVNNKGEEILPCKYSSVYPSRSFIIAQEQNSSTIMDSNGKTIIHTPHIGDWFFEPGPFIYFEEDNYNGLLCAYTLEGKLIEKIDNNNAIPGNISIVPNKLNICCLYNYRKKRYQIYDKNGNLILKCRTIYSINRNGKEIVEFEKRKGKYGRIEKKNDEIQIVWY